MIIGARFPGDENKTLMQVQHDVYMFTVGKLYDEALNRYLQAARPVGVETELTKRLRKRKGFDHRVLQDAHDHIAAYYRFRGCPVEYLILLQGSDPGLDAIKCHWQEYFAQQCWEIAQNDLAVIEILTAVAYENTEKGYEAEERLMAILKERYPLEG